jgi:8-oxo-dGTP diphosphatase
MAQSVTEGRRKAHSPSRTAKVAAGVVAIRGEENREVLLVHRPRYDDWSLPKGGVEGDEAYPETAVREFMEETGHRVAQLGMPLGHISYPLSGVMKHVYWWRGVVAHRRVGAPLDPKEIDQAAWVPVGQAVARMSYDDEAEVLEAALSAPDTTPFIVARHAKALAREDWDKPDPLRPLAARGKRQAARLRSLLNCYGITALASSSSIRCVQTLQPMVTKRKSPKSIELCYALSEESAQANPLLVSQTMRSLRSKSLETGLPMAVCGHRPVLPEMIETLGITYDHPMKTAEALVAHLDATGRVLATEWHRSPE